MWYITHEIFPDMNPANTAPDIKTFSLRQTQKLIKIIKFSKTWIRHLTMILRMCGNMWLVTTKISKSHFLLSFTALSVSQIWPVDADLVVDCYILSIIVISYLNYVPH